MATLRRSARLHQKAQNSQQQQNQTPSKPNSKSKPSRKSPRGRAKKNSKGDEGILEESIGARPRAQQPSSGKANCPQEKHILPESLKDQDAVDVAVEKPASPNLSRKLDKPDQSLASKAVVAAVKKPSSPKRSRELDEPDQSPGSKRSRTSPTSRQDPLRYWASHSVWPPNYFDMSTATESQPRKRLRTPSYAESSRDEQARLAQMVAAESDLAEEGVISNYIQSLEFISEQSKAMCLKMLQSVPTKKYDPAVGYPIDKLKEVLLRLYIAEEAEVVRDLTPLLVPSPKHLALWGNPGLKFVSEHLDADWKNIKLMGGPPPRPNITIGLSLFAFNRAERKKLDNHKSFERATWFTHNVLFPFFICEVKGCGEGISQASNRATHSGALAVNAIWQLYRAAEEICQRRASTNHGILDNIDVLENDEPLDNYGAFPSGVFTAEEFDSMFKKLFPDQAMGDDVFQTNAETIGNDVLDEFSSRNGAASSNISVKELNGQILAFSIAHNDYTVQLFGHFPFSKDGDTQPTIYRHLIDSFSVLGDEFMGGATVRNFVLDCFDKFPSIHLERIRRALSVMREPALDVLAVNDARNVAFPMDPPSESASQMNQRLLQQQVAKIELERKAEREQAKADLEAERLREKAHYEAMQAQITQLLDIIKQQNGASTAK